MKKQIDLVPTKLARRRAFTAWAVTLLALAALLALPGGRADAQPSAKRARARDLGVPFDGTPGPRNAITDVPGVEIGATTLVSGEGKLVRGKGPVRTGVTAVFPRGKEARDPVFAGWFSLNGNGEMTGTAWLAESGFLAGPIAITNTHSVGVVHDAVIKWQIERDRIPLSEPADYFWSLPVVAETWDGYLNDINGFHVKESHVFSALDGARGGAVPEGNVGGGTGMVCYGFKGGNGTASRALPKSTGGTTLGVFVQCNCGRRNQLTIAGVPFGREVPLKEPAEAASNEPGPGGPTRLARGERPDADVGSIIIVVATDAPLLPHQLERLARRATMGLARTGSVSGNGSGDLFLAFSTANPGAARDKGTAQVTTLANEEMNPIFTATVEATEEAIVNAMLGAETMTGADGHTIEALPHEKLRAALVKYGRRAPQTIARDASAPSATR